MNPSSAIFRLEIGAGDAKLTVLGGPTELGAVVDEWRDWKASISRDESRVLDISGFCDSADRAPVRAVAPMASIVDVSVPPVLRTP